MLKIRKFIYPKIRTVKPFWSDREFSAGFQHTSINPLETEEVFKTKMTNILKDTDLYIVPTSSGRSAIELALSILKSNKPDRREVIIPSYSCKGIIDPIFKNNLKPVFADIDNNLLLSETDVINKINKNTLAVLIVNLSGKEAQTDQLIEAAKKNNSFIILDNCQNLRPRLEDVQDFTVYSFGIGKTIMTTGGGALVTKNHIKETKILEHKLQEANETDARIRFRYFYSKYFKNKETGIDPTMFSNAYKLNKMSALDMKIGLIQLDKLDEIILKYQNNAKNIISEISKYPGIYSVQNISNHLYTKLPVISDTTRQLENLMQQMDKLYIEYELMYKPLHNREDVGNKVHFSLPNTERLAPLVLNIPNHPGLSSSDTERVKLAINKSIK